MTSLAPREAKWSAVARPIPRDAPVTMATRSWSGKDGVGAVLAALLVSEAIIIGLETRENQEDSYLFNFSTRVLESQYPIIQLEVHFSLRLHILFIIKVV